MRIFRALALIAAVFLLPGAASAQTIVAEHPSTPLSVKILSATYLGTNALDSYTTMVALRHPSLGESNPLLSPMMSSPATMIAAKTALAVTAVALTNRIAPNHRAAAIVTLVALNIGTAMVAAHNASLARAMGR